MEFDQPIRFGSLCPRCDKGMMKIKGRFPSCQKLGLTTVVYECSECRHIVAQSQDGRMCEDGIPGVLQMPSGLVFDRLEMRRERPSLPRFLLFLPFWSIGDTLGTTRPNDVI
jgi:hypothetical protein